MSNAGSGQPIDFAKPFRLGGCDVDPATCRVHNGDQVVKLQPQVISVLINLAARPGRVISRNEIESVVWEGKTVGYDALTGTMFKLRKALGDDPKSPRLNRNHIKEGLSPAGRARARIAAARYHLSSGHC